MGVALSGQTHAYVYVIGLRDDAVKVGFALWPERRCHQLRLRDAADYQVLEAVRVDRCDAVRVERLAHHLLEATRCDGEWFRTTPKAAAEAIAEALRLRQVGFRPIANGPSGRINVIATEELLSEVEEWRSRQRPIPNKSEAARMLIERGLEAERIAKIRQREADD